MRPSWQMYPCPSWCTASHDESDHPDDRVHQNVGVEIPTIVRRRAFDGTDRYEQIEQCTLAVLRIQREGDQQVWRCFDNAQGFELELTEESYHRLVDAMLADPEIRLRYERQQLAD